MGGSSGKGTTTTENKIPAELSGLTSQTAGKIQGIQQAPGFDVAEYGRSNIQKIPGLSPGQREGILQSFGVGETPYSTNVAGTRLSQAGEFANQSGRATGGTLATDPSLAAAYNTYKSTVAPDLQSQFGLMGLGKSTQLGDALARGAASQLQPATEAALGREQQANEARIGRQTSTALQSAGQFAGLGNDEVNRRLQSLQALTSTGGVERGVESERAAAEQQDALRRQALSEQAVFGVLGQLPSTLGQSVASKTASSGMFKIIPWFLLAWTMLFQ